MTDDEITIAIAEECAWTREWVNKERHIQQWVCRRPDGSVDYCDPDPDAGWEVHHLPPYPTDLNAMHEAEKVLYRGIDKQRYWQAGYGRFKTILGEICDEPFSASARQRAEAFLRTIGKWKG